MCTSSSKHTMKGSVFPVLCSVITRKGREDRAGVHTHTTMALPLEKTQLKCEKACGVSRICSSWPVPSTCGTPTHNRELGSALLIPCVPSAAGLRMKLGREAW